MTKITFIGAGSTVFARRLLTDLLSFPELAGCAADGPTYQEALAAVEVVINEWIETARELGRPIPEHRGRLLRA